MKMGQPPHFDIDGAIFFITTRLNEKGRLLTDEEAGIIQNVIVDMATKKELKLYAYVVMPNHLHVLVQPIDNGISKTMQLIKGRSSRKINILRENAKGTTTRCMGDISRPINVWQKGFFDFTILTEQKFKEKFNYVHYNPVKWGLVNNAEEYEYSSASEYKIRYGEVFYT